MDGGVIGLELDLQKEVRSHLTISVPFLNYLSCALVVLRPGQHLRVPPHPVSVPDRPRHGYSRAPRRSETVQYWKTQTREKEEWITIQLYIQQCISSLSYQPLLLFFPFEQSFASSLSLLSSLIRLVTCYTFWLQRQGRTERMAHRDHTGRTAAHYNPSHSDEREVSKKEEEPFFLTCHHSLCRSLFAYVSLSASVSVSVKCLCCLSLSLSLSIVYRPLYVTPWEERGRERPTSSATHTSQRESAHSSTASQPKTKTKLPNLKISLVTRIYCFDLWKDLEKNFHLVVGNVHWEGDANWRKSKKTLIDKIHLSIEA